MNNSSIHHHYEIISLEDPNAAVTSAFAVKPVLWTCTRAPREVLGLLAENFQGAWHEGGRIHLNVGRRSASRKAAPGTAHPAALRQALLDFLSVETAPKNAKAAPHNLPLCTI